MRWQYWKWFFFGIDASKSGLLSLFDRWIFLHLIIAVALMALIETSIKNAASTVLLPLASIFIGLSFAWAGNAQALMQTDEITELSDYLQGGLPIYAYKFQTAILVILITLSAWGLGGLGVFENTIFLNTKIQNSIEITLYFLASFTLRECWHVVLGSQVMLIMRYNIKRNKKQQF